MAPLSTAQSVRYAQRASLVPSGLSQHSRFSTSSRAGAPDHRDAQIILRLLPRSMRKG
jgi:hypothetical protein